MNTQVAQLNGSKKVQAMAVTSIDPQQVYKKISSYSFDGVRERILKEEAMSMDEYDQALQEYWKFLTLVAIGNDGLGMFSEKVDEIWHTHILFTREYMTFCDEVFGRYLHHAPNLEASPGNIPENGISLCSVENCFIGGPDPDPTCRGSDDEDDKVVALGSTSTAQQFRSAYTSTFGQLPAIWGTLSTMECEHNCMIPTCQEEE